MSTENQNQSTDSSTKLMGTNQLTKMATKLEELKGNAVKPLSLRPNRSVKKNSSLKPIGLKAR